MATFRNLAIGLLKTLGAGNIAKTTRAIRDEPERALPLKRCMVLRVKDSMNR